MDTAIDISYLGKEKEVSAEEAYEKGYGRFKCPECGEPVSLVIPFEIAHKKYFKHGKQTENSPECSLRVEGNGNQSIYERLGIPLYLRTDGINYYFAAGFRHLPSDVLRYCEEQKGEMKIIIDNKETKFYINSLRFHSEGITYIKLPQLPIEKPEIRVDISSPSKFWIINYWARYINWLLPEYGSLFSINQREGKIIRPGESISTFTPYYWVTKMNEEYIKRRLRSARDRVDLIKMGNIKMNVDYNIYKISVNVSLKESEDKYRTLFNYFYDNLKVSLLEKPSTIVPVWPPCTKSNDGYVLGANGDTIGKIISPNDEPVIFQYIGDYKRSQSCLVMNSDESLRIIPVDDVETFVSVDRKISSTGLLFKKRKYDYEGINNLLLMDNEDLTNVTEKVIEQKDILHFSSYNSLSIIRIQENGLMSEEKKQSGEFIIEQLSDNERIYFLSQNFLILKLIVKENGIRNSSELGLWDELEFQSVINRSSGKFMVRISPKIRMSVLGILSKIKNSKIRRQLKEILKKNVIAVDVLDYIERELT